MEKRKVEMPVCRRGGERGCFLLIFVSLGKLALAEKIEDNSFLVEEAYNREPGMVQHIQTFKYNYGVRFAIDIGKLQVVPGFSYYKYREGRQ